MKPDKQPRDRFDEARRTIEGADVQNGRGPDREMPAAGPHAKEVHTNKEATPGAGALPSVKPTDDVEPGTG
jgi:hypothetical protein